MSKEIIEVLDNACEKFGVAVDWGSDNVLPYLTDLVHRYTQYKIANSVFYIIIGILMLLSLIGLFKLIIWSYKKSKECGIYDSDAYDLINIIAGIAFVIFMILGVIIILVNISSIIELSIIPEKSFIDYIRSLQ